LWPLLLLLLLLLLLSRRSVDAHRTAKVAGIAWCRRD
jgi:hypothetical protein